MSRPDEVRCENCVYWGGGYDGCKRFPSFVVSVTSSEVFEVRPMQAYEQKWCGEWRKEWPGER